MSPSNSSIPRLIIQTARSRDLPPFARAAARNLRLLHPDWEYLFFDDADVARFVAQEFPQYRTIFESFPHKIQRFDFFRYLAVLRHGGFYFDLDVFLFESIEALTAQRCVFPFEELTLNRFLREEHDFDFEIGNYAFGAAPQHPFLAAIIENCLRAQRDRSWVRPMFRGIPHLFRSDFEVLCTSGPGLITRTLAEDLSRADNITVIYPGEPGACDTSLERNWHRFGRYGVHLMDGSWRQRGNFLRRKAALLWETRARRQLLSATRSRNSTPPAPVPTFL